MANTPLGWYKWYPRDFMASSTVRKMSVTAQGVYRALLDLQWEDGRVPLSYPEASLILHLTTPEQNAFEPFFNECFPNGINEKLDEQRRAQIAAINRQIESGKRGGKVAGKGRPKKTKGSLRGTPNQTETDNTIELDKSNSAKTQKTEQKTTQSQARFQRIKDVLQSLNNRKGWGDVMDADVKRNLGKGKPGLGELLEWLDQGKAKGSHNLDCNDAAIQLYLKSESEFEGKTSWEAVFNHKGRLWDLVKGAGKSSNPIIEGTRFQFKGEEVAV